MAEFLGQTAVFSLSLAPTSPQSAGALPAKTICLTALRQLYEKLNSLQNGLTHVNQAST